MLLALLCGFSCTSALSGIKDSASLGRRTGLRTTDPFRRTTRGHSVSLFLNNGEDLDSRKALPEKDSRVSETNLPSLASDDSPTTRRRDRKSRTNIVLGTLIGSLTVLGLLAKTGILPGPIDSATGSLGTYTDLMIFRDIGSTLASAGLAYFVVKLITAGYDQGIYSSKISRKLSHTLLAPFFIIVYPIFSGAEGARFFAAVVTVVNAVRLYLAATGDDESSLARSVSRSGDKMEALGGPFIYVCLLSVFILLFWRSTMTGIVATATMAAGDGMADLVGRRWGRNNKWWFSQDKSVAGTTAFAFFATLTSYALVNWLQLAGCLSIGLESTDLFLRIALIGTLCSFVELLPVGDDNFTVPASAALLSAYLLR